MSVSDHNESTVSWPSDSNAILELDLERHGIHGKLVANNDTYRVIDYNIEGVTVSVTTLHEGKATRGHSHPHAEAYFFLTDAELEIDYLFYPVKSGDVKYINPHAFHRVHGSPRHAVKFISVFFGTRDESKVNYHK